jgi:hypothetical protein
MIMDVITAELSVGLRVCTHKIVSQTSICPLFLINLVPVGAYLKPDLPELRGIHYTAQLRISGKRTWQ